MTPPTSIIGRLVHLRLFERFTWRLGVFGVAILALLVLTLFPERYKGAASLTPLLLDLTRIDDGGLAERLAIG